MIEQLVGRGTVTTYYIDLGFEQPFSGYFVRNCSAI